MNRNEKISIIVPAYNISAYLPRCLDSLLTQTYSNIEIVVVDDGSTDDTAKILESYALKDSRIKPICKENGGVTRARFCGIKHATGEWIGFVDGDDAVDSDMYERLLINAKKYDAQISHCGHRTIHEDGRIRYFYNTGRVEEQNTVSGLKDLLDGSFVEPGLWNKLFHKDLFQNLLYGSEMDLTIRNNEDLLMNVILFKQAQKAIYEDFCPYQYYARQGSATRKGLAEYMYYDTVRVKEQLVKIVPSELKEQAKKTYAMACVSLFNELLTRGKEARSLQHDMRQKLIQDYDYVVHLPVKYRCMASCIRYAPWIYKSIYTVYSLSFRENIYE